MKRVALLLALLLVPALRASGEDAPRATPIEAADAVARAVAAHDAQAVQELAGRDDPDPWLVADVLMAGGLTEEARAFGCAAPRKTVEGLQAYLTTDAARVEAAPRKALESLEPSLAANAFEEALATTAFLAAEDAPPLPRSVVHVRLAVGRATALQGSRRTREAVTLFATAADAAREMGWLGFALATYRRAAAGATAAGDRQGALAHWQSTLALSRVLEDPWNVASTLLHRVAKAQTSVGDDEGALGSYAEAAAIFRAGDDRLNLAMALYNGANAEQRLGRFTPAVEHYDEALDLSRALGQGRGTAFVLSASADLLRKLGSYEQARTRALEALRLFETAKDRHGIGRVHGSLGNVHQRMGAYPLALKHHGLALEQFRALADARAIASTLNNLGNVHLRLGNYLDAIAAYTEALERFRTVGDQRGEATALGNLGSVKQAQGEGEAARTRYEEALEVFRVLEDRPRRALLLNDLGNLALRLGQDPELALGRYEEALALFRELDDRAGIAMALNNVGNVYERRGRAQEAEKAYQEALALLETHPDPPTHVVLLWSLAYLRLQTGRPAEAVALAREGIERVAGLAEGLADEEGASARDSFKDLFDVGVRAALAAKDQESLSWMLEQGRAEALRRGLASRSALEAAVVPEALRLALATVRGQERLAVEAYRRVSRAGRLGEVRTAREQMVAAQDQVRLVIQRMQREARSAAQLMLPDVDGLKQIQDRLGASEVIVSYALTDGEAAAVVVGAGGTRVVPLGPSQRVREAALALQIGDLSVPLATIAKAGAALRTLLVEPLGLDASVRRVMFSPTEELGYVPFALLLPDKELAYVPSATTYGVLLAQATTRGEGVLALGDPDYSAHPARLAPLPATREEIRTLGTRQLLGKDANETALASALTEQPRWRAVHFACHGLVDPERPWRSSLALTPDGEGDGFLTSLEIFRMDIPTDLVVLSACETGRGKIYKTEGIVGLTRAFMFAGAPRVICSLWKVDDVATRALMLKFYELWNPVGSAAGLQPADALRQAQAFVRGRPGWEHPYYWAAWVLWGLPTSK